MNELILKSMFNSQQHTQGFLNTKSLKGLIKGINDFEYAPQKTTNDIALLEIKRLGKRAEFLFEQLLRNTENLEILASNVQLIEKSKTLGEIDYLLKFKNKTIHLELATKFYLFDGSINSDFINQWIGPNRKDYLHLKLDKLKNHQFPIVKTEAFRNSGLPIPDQQSLLLKAMLFIPFEYSQDFTQNFEECVVGYWYKNEQFSIIEEAEFFIPEKLDWFIQPELNKTWKSKSKIIEEIKDFHSRNFSPMVWIKRDNKFERCFVVWW